MAWKKAKTPDIDKVTINDNIYKIFFLNIFKTVLIVLKYNHTQIWDINFYCWIGIPVNHWLNYIVINYCIKFLSTSCNINFFPEDHSHFSPYWPLWSTFDTLIPLNNMFMVYNKEQLREKLHKE